MMMMNVQSALYPSLFLR